MLLFVQHFRFMAEFRGGMLHYGQNLGKEQSDRKERLIPHPNQRPRKCIFTAVTPGI